MPIITISGSPGTGKTAAARELRKATGFRIISLKGLVKSGKISSGWDRKRKVRIVDEKTLERDVKKLIKPGRSYIIEGGLAHFIKGNICVILRTDPAVLSRRLKRRGWGREKVRENVMAEMLDESVIEAKSLGRKIVEIDTTKAGPEAAALSIKMALNNYRLQRKYRPKINWTGKYPKLLAKIGA
ncbi:MAG: AAA family ATPase [Candidatus Aenigmarchaeota archaeon]|nr:AAA family ATPase [Candidatus Aenigmarchaeota archaeon]